MNLLKHEKDFGAKAEWNFFATLHGPFWSILQNKCISTPRLLYEWAKTFFKKIEFEFSTTDEHSIDDKTLKARYAMVKTVKNTRQYHFYTPVDDSRVSCKIFSTSTKLVIEDVMKTEVNKK